MHQYCSGDDHSNREIYLKCKSDRNAVEEAMQRQYPCSSFAARIMIVSFAHASVKKCDAIQNHKGKKSKCRKRQYCCGRKHRRTKCQCFRQKIKKCNSYHCSRTK